MPVDPPSAAAVDAAVSRLVALRPVPGAIRVPPVADLPEVHGRVWRPVPPAARLAAGAATVGAVAAGVALLASTLPSEGPSGTQPQDVALATGANGGVVPIVSVQGDQASTELTLADGSRLDLQFPAGNDLAAEGFLPNPQFDWPVREPAEGAVGCCSREVFVLHTPRDELLAGQRPTETYDGADGASVLWFDQLARLGRAELREGGYLVYSYEAWTAAVWTGPPTSEPASATDTMTASERRTWASSVRGQTDEDGYLVLSPSGPLEWADVPFPDGVFGSDGPLGLGIYVGPCDPEALPGDQTVSLCFPDQDVEVRLSRAGLQEFGDPGLVTVDVLEAGPLFELAG